MIPSIKPSVVSAVAVIAISLVLNINIIHSFQLLSSSPINKKCTDPSTSSSLLSNSPSAILIRGRQLKTVLHFKKPRTANIVEMSKLLQHQSQSTIGQHSQKELERNYKKKEDDWLKLDIERELSNATPPPNRKREIPVKIVFSDIDGSLVHYDKSYDNDQQQELNGVDDNKLIFLPPSATGLQGVISSQTLQLCQKLRLEKNVKLVLITGARTSTLLNRLPYLPKADVYVSEGGGRIFYPTNVDNCCIVSDEEFVYKPVQYSGSKEEDLQSFSLVEDMEWREHMISGGVGNDYAYVGNEILSKRCDGTTSDNEEECIIDYDTTAGFPIDAIPIEQRTGILWEYATHLIENEGFILDTKSYSTMFRVSRKHQVNDKKFDALLDGTISHPKEISMSTNLGCIDFFPVVSGKQNWYAKVLCVTLNLCCIFCSLLYLHSTFYLAVNTLPTTSVIVYQKNLYDM